MRADVLNTATTYETSRKEKNRCSSNTDGPDTSTFHDAAINPSNDHIIISEVDETKSVDILPAEASDLNGETDFGEPVTSETRIFGAASEDPHRELQASIPSETIENGSCTQNEENTTQSFSNDDIFVSTSIVPHYQSKIQMASSMDLFFTTSHVDKSSKGVAVLSEPNTVTRLSTLGEVFADFASYSQSTISPTKLIAQDILIAEAALKLFLERSQD
jgi:hypothetical protein